MKVIQINHIYPFGSTGKMTKDLHDCYSDAGFESFVIYGHGPKGQRNCFKISSELYFKWQALLSRISGIPYGGCLFSTKKAVSIIKRINPDVVHIQCINGHIVNIYKLLSWLKKNRIKTILTIHAEFMFTGSCGHAYDCEKWRTGCGHCARFKKETGSWFFDKSHCSWFRMQRAFEGFDNIVIVSVSPWLMKRASESPMLSNKKHLTIFNGVDDVIFTRRASDALKKELGLSSRKVFLHVTPFFDPDKNHNKGGYYVLSLAKKHPEMSFLVVGSHSKGLEVPKNVLLLGRLNDQKLLSNCYSLADATLVVSKRETFSMPVAESLCCGTPVVGFYSGGPESIGLKEHCFFVEYGNLQALDDCLERVLADKKNAALISEQAKKIYSKNRMGEEYIKLIEKITHDYDYTIPQ